MSVRFRTIDVETTGETADDAIIEIAAIDVVDGAVDINSARRSFVNPQRPIPPESRAVHHISDADVAGAPLIGNVIGPILAAKPAPDYFVAHKADFEQMFISPLISGPEWICTLKCAMRLWPSAPKHTNQVLRYWLDFGDLGPMAMPPHRALPDAFVTGHIVTRMLPLASPEEMARWTTEPPHYPRCNITDFSGRRNLLWPDVGADFLRWIINKDGMEEDMKFNARREVMRRADAARDAYVVGCKVVVAEFTARDQIENWFKSETQRRYAIGIEQGSIWFSQIGDACKDRLKELPQVTTGAA